MDRKPTNRVTAGRRAALAVALMLTLGACQTQPVSMPGMSSGQTVSFSQQVQPIFNELCITCHVTGGLADLEGIALKLTAAESFNRLVNQSSVQDTSLTLVVPGDSTNSLLFKKVSSNSPPVGATMPLIGRRLTSDELTLIRDWIDQGAMNN